LVPLRHFHAERYLYPAYWGLLAVVLIGLIHHRVLDRLIPVLARRADAKKWGYAALALVAIATASVTAASNLFWWSDETLFRDATLRDPHYVEGRLGLALSAVQKGDLAQAVALSRRAIEEGNDASHTAYWAPFVAHLNLAGALDGLQRRDQAYAAYREALRYRPDDPRVLCRAGQAALALARPAQAMEHLRRAAAKGPTGFECDLARALAHVELSEWRAALAQLSLLAAERPRNLPARRAWIRTQLELDRVAEADESLRELLLLAPDRADLRALEAWVLFERREGGAATEVWRRGYELDPAEPLLWEVVARFESDFLSPPLPLPPRATARPEDG
jgi:predicted Zn-dependent protease